MKGLRDLRSDDVTVQSRPGHRKVRRLLGTIIDRKLSSPLWTEPTESISSTWRRIFVLVHSWISNFCHRAPNSETCRTIDLMLTFGESSNAQTQRLGRVACARRPVWTTEHDHARQHRNSTLETVPHKIYKKTRNRVRHPTEKNNMIHPVAASARRRAR